MMAKLLVVVFIALTSLACASAQKYTHAQALAKVRAVGIRVQSPNCSNRNRRCLSLDQVRTNTIDTRSGGITRLKTASGCDIVITGGTEIGHASGTYSHWNGYKLDVRLNGCINNYITRSFKFIGPRRSRWSTSIQICSRKYLC